MNYEATVLIYAINRTDAWWQYVAKHTGFARHVVVSDIRGAADRDVVADFNAAFRLQYAYSDIQTLTFTEAEVKDIIARCRLLRWLPPKQARSMVAAMECAFSKVLDDVQPQVVVSFPIDRYVSDVLERLARRRGIPYVELTASLFSGMCMLMYRGQLIKTSPPPTEEVLEEQIRIIANPSFTPSYVQTTTRYTRARWLKTFTYFKVRGWGFKLISWEVHGHRTMGTASTRITTRGCPYPTRIARLMFCHFRRPLLRVGLGPPGPHMMTPGTPSSGTVSRYLYKIAQSPQTQLFEPKTQF